MRTRAGRRPCTPCTTGHPDYAHPASEASAAVSRDTRWVRRHNIYGTCADDRYPCSSITCSLLLRTGLLDDPRSPGASPFGHPWRPTYQVSLCIRPRSLRIHRPLQRPSSLPCRSVSGTLLSARLSAHVPAHSRRRCTLQPYPLLRKRQTWSGKSAL